MKEVNPWAGVAMQTGGSTATGQEVQRRGPVEQRVLENVEVLAGNRGEKLDHAVRFRDLNFFIDNLQAQFTSNSAAFAGEVTAKINRQFAAIDAESKAIVADFTAAFTQLDGLVATFSETFTAQLNTTNANIQTNYYTIAQTDQAIAAVQTTVNSQLNGFSTTITQLQSTANGIDATYGIRINNNGHVSGFGLISRLRNGQPVSDFIITDASFRVVNTSGQGNYTPLAVYPSGRVVDGVFVPAGVHAQDLYVTRANIANAAIDSARIADAAITNAKIADASITNAKIAFAAIDSTKIQDAAITSAKIGFAQIQSANIQDLTIGTQKIQDFAVTTGAAFSNAPSFGAVAASCAGGRPVVIWASIAFRQMNDIQVSYTVFWNGVAIRSGFFSGNGNAAETPIMLVTSQFGTNTLSIFTTLGNNSSADATVSGAFIELKK